MFTATWKEFSGTSHARQLADIKEVGDLIFEEIEWSKVRIFSLDHRPDVKIKNEDQD